MKFFSRFRRKGKKHKEPDSNPRFVTTLEDTDDFPTQYTSVEGIQSLDLKLPNFKRPWKVSKFHEIWTPLPSQRLADAQISNMTYAIGSAKTDDEIYYQHDTGLFQCIHEAWINHWNLRTSPEDWWFPVVCRIAKAIELATSVGNEHCPMGSKVRNYLVAHGTGKKTLSVEIPAHTIYEADYNQLFNAMSSQLVDSLLVPELVDEMTSDFGSTTTTTHRIASQVNLMAGLQHMFDYDARFSSCGLQSVELVGSDWDRLSQKLARLRKVLEPIMEELAVYNFGLTDEWWDHVAYCFDMLAKTYHLSTKNRNHHHHQQQQQQYTQPQPQGEDVATAVCSEDTIEPQQQQQQQTLTISSNNNNNDKDESEKVLQFWDQIIVTHHDYDLGYASFGPRTQQTDFYDGWLIHFLTAKQKQICAKTITNDPETQQTFSGLNQAPMTVSLTWMAAMNGDDDKEEEEEEGSAQEGQGIIVSSDKAQIVAGIMGFELIASSSENSITTCNGVPSLRPYHMWAMMLPPDSKLRNR